MLKFVVQAALAAALAAQMAAPVWAQDWPRQPIRLVVSFGAGGGADIVVPPPQAISPVSGRSAAIPTSQMSSFSVGLEKPDQYFMPS